MVIKTGPDVVGKKVGALGIRNNFLKQNVAKTTISKDTSGGVFGQFLGTITKTGPKFGFIECPEVSLMSGSSNVFILADEMKQYQVGQEVKFTAYMDSQGRLQGKDLKCWDVFLKSAATPASWSALSVLKAIASGNVPQQISGGPYDGGFRKPMAPKDTGGGELGEFLGVITKTGPKFGFIESPDVENTGGGSSNVFILADELRQYQVGQQVKFTAYFDSQGRLQGKDLKSGLKGVVGLLATPMPSGGGSRNTTIPKDTSGGELGEFLGTIQNRGPKFGFVECPDLKTMGHSSKVFILSDELRQYQVGDEVRFTAYLDGKGQLQGKDLNSGQRLE
jgi:hypothetical protein